MARTVAIGEQDFSDIREHGCFLVDKTRFIERWWDARDEVTLICRPRRFGKTLTLRMVECFFSSAYVDRADLFEGLEVWSREELRAEQGAWPVVFLSFAGIKAPDFAGTRAAICREIARLFERNRDLLDGGLLGENERAFFAGVRDDMPDDVAAVALNRLCEFLSRRAGRRAIVLLDEYDTPMQEAWLRGYWDKMASFIRMLFNATFKTNPFLERALITGITRVAEESIFSDMNNPEVVTTSSDKYADCFGFTEGEVFSAMDEFGLADKDKVKYWYDGFTFGATSDIYNPWSITKYLDSGGILDTYWANTSGNGLASSLIREGDEEVKADFEELLRGGSVRKVMSEHVAFKALGRRPGAMWSLLLASGYLKVVSSEFDPDAGVQTCELSITNRETMVMFDQLILDWFNAERTVHSPFVRALLAGDLRGMNRYMNRVALDTFSSFDAANHPAESEPERFYHGFVLGLLVELRGRYEVLSNRESGYGRYDVMLAPLDPSTDDGIVIEFKVIDPEDGEATLEDTVVAAKAQIADKRYAASLEVRGVPVGRVREYGFAFQGKRVLIG